MLENGLKNMQEGMQNQNSKIKNQTQNNGLEQLTSDLDTMVAYKNFYP